MKTIGITGNIGSNLDFVCDILKKEKARIINVNKIVLKILDRKTIRKKISKSLNIDYSDIYDLFEKIQNINDVINIIKEQIVKKVQKNINNERKGSFCVLSGYNIGLFGLDEMCEVVLFLDYSQEYLLSSRMILYKWNEDFINRINNIQIFNKYDYLLNIENIEQEILYYMIMDLRKCIFDTIFSIKENLCEKHFWRTNKNFWIKTD